MPTITRVHCPFFCSLASPSSPAAGSTTPLRPAARLPAAPPPAASVSGGKKVSVYLLPKKKGIAYFSSCADGAQSRQPKNSATWTSPTTGRPTGRLKRPRR